MVGFATQLSLVLAIGAALFALGWFFVCVIGTALEMGRKRQPPTDEPNWNVIRERMENPDDVHGGKRPRLKIRSFSPTPEIPRLSWFSAISKPLDRD
jgi:hypothetical protein